MPELTPGVPRALSPLVRRVVAPDAGPAGRPGTNTYLVGIDEVAVIDPGPDDPGHVEALVGCGGDRIRWILLTHRGAHGAGAARLRDRTGAEVLAFAPDDEVPADGRLVDGDQLEATEFRLAVVHTPGHAPDHCCFVLEEERLLFSGDELVEEPGVVAIGPDGDLGAHVARLERLAGLRLRGVAPGHGEVIPNAPAVLRAHVEAQRALSGEIEAALRRAGEATADDLAAGVLPELWNDHREAAAALVDAHLRALSAAAKAAPGAGGVWRPGPPS